MSKHETKLRVQYYETDAMGIVHHSNYIRYFETARTEMMRSHGYAYDEMEKSGIYMPVLSVAIDYKTPAVYDEEISVFCWIEELKGASMTFGYEVVNSDSGVVHAKGTSGHGFTSPELKPLRLKKEAPELYEVFVKVKEESQE